MGTMGAPSSPSGARWLDSLKSLDLVRRANPQTLANAARRRPAEMLSDLDPKSPNLS